jgi:hypothetical protein
MGFNMVVHGVLSTNLAIYRALWGSNQPLFRHESLADLRRAQGES